MTQIDCDECGAVIIITVGMDAYSKVTHYTTTTHEELYFCNESCMKDYFESTWSDFEHVG